MSSGGDRHYQGAQVEGFGNEIFISSGGEQLKKSISRSTVDLALNNALAQKGCVTGSKALGIPGARSYLYPILVRFGVMKETPWPIRSGSIIIESDCNG